jgi:hypothetical protein
MEIILDLQSPYTPDRTLREDLPTGEVLAWDGNEWANGFLEIDGVCVILCDAQKPGIYFTSQRAAVCTAANNNRKR